MIRTIEEIREAFGADETTSLEDIGLGGGLLPQILSDNEDEVVEILYCDMISGGKEDINNLPKNISLTKVENIDGELHEYVGLYQLVKVTQK